jgi:hypothetical protein
VPYRKRENQSPPLPSSVGRRAHHETRKQTMIREPREKDASDRLVERARARLKRGS